MSAAQRVRSPAQNTRIWSLMGEWQKLSGLDREELKGHLETMCSEVSGQSHSSRLSPDQADRVIGQLQDRVHAARPAPAPAAAPAKAEPFVHWTQKPPVGTPEAEAPTRGSTITPRQQQVLGKLYEMVGMSTPQQRSGFSMRQCGKPWPQSQVDCDKIMEALKAMAMRKVDPADIQRRVAAMSKSTKLDAWKTNFIADISRQFSTAADIASVLSPYKLQKILECEAAHQGG